LTTRPVGPDAVNAEAWHAYGDHHLRRGGGCRSWSGSTGACGDEARETEDPVHLVRVLGISIITAMKYIHAAHPHRAGPVPHWDRRPPPRQRVHPRI